MTSLKERFFVFILGLIGVYGFGYIIYYFDSFVDFPFWFGLPTFLIFALSWIFSALLSLAAIFSSDEEEDDDPYGY